MNQAAVAAASLRRPKASPALARPAPAQTKLLGKAGCACGGACPRCIEDSRTASVVSLPGDALELAAERRADAVMGRAGPYARAPARTRPKTDDATPGGLPSSVARALAGAGEPLAPSLRADMEARFEADLGAVRVFRDATATGSARELQAEAYTVGDRVVFDAAHYDPRSRAGRHLLAHELAHVTQPATATAAAPPIQRRLAADYATIESNLTYGVFDWAITDGDAREVLAVLGGLSDADLADTVAAMDRDGLVDRLLDNVADDDEEANAVLLGRITRHRSTSHSRDWIVGRLSRGSCDWVITDDDARQALHALMGLESQELRTVVAAMTNAGVYDRLEEELATEELVRYPAFLTRLRSIRDEFNALVGAHVDFLRSQSDSSTGETGAGAAISGTVRDIGYGGAPATWNDLDSATQDDWRRRAGIAIARVIESVAGTDLEAVLARGELVFAPQDAEPLNAYAYVVGENRLFFGRGWVRDAEADPVRVWQSIAHELGGHEEFGSTWSWEIMQATLARLTPAERAQATSGSNSVYSAYGYLETELYAELRELPYRVAGSGGDEPGTDVPQQLRRIQQVFGPVVGRQIVIRLYYRVVQDPRVVEAARRLLYQSVQDVFGLFPIGEDIAP